LADRFISRIDYAVARAVENVAVLTSTASDVCAVMCNYQRRSVAVGSADERSVPAGNWQVSVAHGSASATQDGFMSREIRP
jgi:hypothetical protein